MGKNKCYLLVSMEKSKLKYGAIISLINQPFPPNWIKHFNFNLIKSKVEIISPFICLPSK